MSYRDWYVGMKVVCVAKGRWTSLDGDSGLPKPKFGEVCTITGFVKHEEEIFLTLAGYDPFDIFDIRQFRPLEERKTDISVFTAMLTDQRQKEPA